jgi:2-haloacid dehalogenase
VAGSDPGLQSVGALTFDVQGTCADFCRPMQGMGEAVNQAKGIAIDWGSVSAEWRSTTSSRAAGRGFAWTVSIARRSTCCWSAMVETFTAAGRDELNAVWSKLEAWPDSVEGLARLRKRFVVSTPSNAGMATMVAVVKHAGLPFDSILTAEFAHVYKPAPAVY